MRFFNGGALRPARDDTRLSAANDLVQRTLAQHGLMPRNEGPFPPHKSTVPSFKGPMAQFTKGRAGKNADLPKGALFQQDTFRCAAGSRDFRTYVPASAQKGVAGVVVMLHGCTQTPQDFAAGTGMNMLAEQHRLVVVYPAQSRGHNAQSCWNWFSPGDQQRGRGEPAILAGLTGQVCAAYGIERACTFVAGLSAGAAMAAIVGESYPDVFAAVGLHSGLPAGSAKDVPSAFAAMGGSALEGPPPRPHANPVVRSIVFHGSADSTVHRSNSDNIVRRALDGVARHSVETRDQGRINGRGFTRKICSDDTGIALVEHWIIDGQGHAWSGGHSAGSYTDPKGPNASAEMIRFFFETTQKDL